MPHPMKEMMVEDLARRLGACRMAVAIDYRGLKSFEGMELRKVARDRRLRFLVVKNSIARLAAIRAGADGLAALLDGPTALLLAQDDVGEMGRVVVEWWKRRKRIVPRGAYVEGRTFGADDIPVLASLPPKPVLLARVAGCVRSPLASLAGALQAHARRIAGLVKAYQETLEKAGGGDRAVPPGPASPETAPSAAPA